MHGFPHVVILPQYCLPSCYISPSETVLPKLPVQCHNRGWSCEMWCLSYCSALHKSMVSCCDEPAVAVVHSSGCLFTVLLGEIVAVIQEAVPEISSGVPQQRRLSMYLFTFTGTVQSKTRSMLTDFATPAPRLTASGTQAEYNVPLQGRPSHVAMLGPQGSKLKRFLRLSGCSTLYCTAAADKVRCAPRS